MRKNYFPDFHRMGLIDRYDEGMNPIGPHGGKRRVKCVALTEAGKRLASAGALDAYFAYSRCIDRLLGGQINVVFRILRDSELDWIDHAEYAFFASGIETRSDFSVSVPEAIDLIKEYRCLTRAQRRMLRVTLRGDLEPTMSAPRRPDKRDLHNWLNEARQVFSLPGQTAYFDARGGRLALTRARSTTAGLARMLLSKSRMKNYFQNHAASRRQGFELHHIVPLAWSESEAQFGILDDWKNALYVDGPSRARIARNGNGNVIMEPRGDDIVLKDPAGGEVCLESGKNAAYDAAKQGALLEHNRKILDAWQE